MTKLSRADEQAVQDWLSAPLDGSDRYRPSRHVPRFGLAYDLLVRVGEGEDTEWIRRTRWYKTHPARADALVRTRQGLGLLGQQARAKRLRKLTLVSC